MLVKQTLGNPGDPLTVAYKLARTANMSDAEFYKGMDVNPPTVWTSVVEALTKFYLTPPEYADTRKAIHSGKMAQLITYGQLESVTKHMRMENITPTEESVRLTEEIFANLISAVSADKGSNSNHR